MMHLLTPRGSFNLFLGFFMAGAVIVLVVQQLTGHPVLPVRGWLDALRWMSRSTAVGAALLLPASHHRVVDWLWIHMRWLSALAPNLNGRYRLVTSSNWGIKQQMRAALAGSPPTPQGTGSMVDQLRTVAGILRIQLGLFRLRIVYEPGQEGPSRSSSRVIGSWLQRNPDTGRFELLYLFRARVTDPTDADEQAYYGAAELELRSERGVVTEFKGTYWTNRSWRKGLNTAGLVTGIRISR